MSLVSFDNVSKFFGDVVALKDFSLEVLDREFIVLLGPSGCGKSTALRIVAGLEQPTRGNILIKGQVVNDVEPKRRDVAMVFQNYALYPHMSVYNNIAFGLRMRGLHRREIDTLVKEAAQNLGLAELLRRKPGELSGGQRQRVALGRAIVRRPVVYLMDEPLSNLDAKLRVQTRAELVKMHRLLQTTFIYVTHDQVEAMTMGDRIAILEQGLLQQVGPPQEVYDRPANVFVADFLGVSNLLRGTVTMGGKQVLVAGAHIAHEGEPGSAVTVVFKADEARFGNDAIHSDSMVEFDGIVEESSFIGTVYRYYVNVNGEMILVDTPEKISASKVKVVVARDKIQVYE